MPDRTGGDADSAPDDAFAELKRIVIGRTGHFYYADKDVLLRERVRERMRVRNLSTVAEYLSLLSGTPETSAEWEALEAEITVGETFFFRYPDQFAALRETVLPAILEANRESKRIRIWSAGCANGAEPYSVAILLHEMLGAALSEWRVSVIGTDINIRALAAARTAHFNAWALRSMTADERARYFTPGAKGIWVLRSIYRALASFQQRNLLSLLDDTLPLQFTEFDLILCRNVLIYFHPDMAARLSRAFAARLGPRRWLFLGHAEAAFAGTPELEAVPLSGTVVYRRTGADAVPLSPQPAWTIPFSGFPLPQAATPLPWQSLPPPILPWPPDAAAEAPGHGDEPADIIGAIRTRADAGDFDAALALCRGALARDGLSARLHFYEGILQRTKGDSAAAEDAFRRALYLDKHYAIAHYHLGLALIDGGKKEAGRRAFANALRLAENLPQATRLEDGDGMSASALTTLARQHLEHRRAEGTP